MLEFFQLFMALIFFVDFLFSANVIDYCKQLIYSIYLLFLSIRSGRAFLNPNQIHYRLSGSTYTSLRK